MLRSFIAFVVHRRLLALCATLSAVELISVMAVTA